MPDEVAGVELAGVGLSAQFVLLAPGLLDRPEFVLALLLPVHEDQIEDAIFETHNGFSIRLALTARNPYLS